MQSDYGPDTSGINLSNHDQRAPFSDPFDQRLGALYRDFRGVRMDGAGVSIEAEWIAFPQDGFPQPGLIAAHPEAAYSPCRSPARRCTSRLTARSLAGLANPWPPSVLDSGP
jgi:hypothetical protein